MKHAENIGSIQSYIDNNRNKLDESLVSLRIMRQIDEFLDRHNLSNKDLAKMLGYSEAYISQLMSGVKNVNVAFINKFEKRFLTTFDFHLAPKKIEAVSQHLEDAENFSIRIDSDGKLISITRSKFTFNHPRMNLVNVSDVECQNL